MKTFTATFFDNKEAMYISNDSPANWCINPIGTWLLDILNCDYDALINTISPFTVQIPSDPVLKNEGYLIISSPSEDEYTEIVTKYNFLSSYSLENWDMLYLDFFPQQNERALREIIYDFKALIEIMETHPEYINHSFLCRYILNGVVQSDTHWVCEEYHPNFPLDDQTYEVMAQKTLAECLEISYRHFCNTENTSQLRYKYHIPKHRIEGILYSSYFEIVRHGKTVKKCKNCGKFFIPENRSDTIYCNNPSPSDPAKTCKEYGTQRLWYEKQKEDELATLSRNILSAKSMLAKRNPDIEDYKLSYDFFRNERIKWKRDVEQGIKTKDEYRKWLLHMQSQKIIKEAQNAHNP